MEVKLGTHVYSIVSMTTTNKNIHTTINGKKNCLGWSMIKIFKEPFARCAKREENHFKEQEEHGSPSPLTIGKGKRKTRAHSHSDCHVQSCEAELAAARAVKEGSVIQQLQEVGEQQRLKNRMAIKASMYPLPCAKPYCSHD